MRCLNCKCDEIDLQDTACPQCKVYLPTVLSNLLPPGTLLRHGTYKVEYALGQGGFGITYLAQHVSLEQRVAIKEFYPKDHAQRNTTTGEVAVGGFRKDSYEEAVQDFQRALRRFEREGRVLARLDHPNVIKVRDHFEERNTGYLVMDYIDPPRTLDDELKARPQKRLPPERVRQIAEQLVDALEAVHEKGVYHLDIKPDNVLLTPKGRVVLIDFGSARQGFKPSTTTKASHTQDYAPREIPAREEVGPESDIYELGMMIHEMLTGELPPNYWSRIRDTSWQPNKVEEPWRTLLAEALRLHREERPSSVRKWWESQRAPASAPAPQVKTSPVRANVDVLDLPPPTPQIKTQSVPAKVEPPKPKAEAKSSPPSPSKAFGAKTSQPISGDVVRCLNCHRDGVPASAKVCPQCGVYLSVLLRDVLPPGTALSDGTYQIKHALEIGALYISYLARHEPSNIDFVIREYFPTGDAVRMSGNVSPKTFTKTEFSQRVEEFLQAARAFALLRHPNLIQIYDQFKERGTGYVVIERVPGRTLREELDLQKERRLPPARVTEIMTQLVPALAVAHKDGICNLDVNPENITLPSDSGRVTFTEFTTKFYKGREFDSTEPIPVYMPPEIMAESGVGPETDIYSLGMTLHEMLTGTLPPSAITRLIKDTWEPTGLDGHWKHLITSALILDRNSRPKDVIRWWSPPPPVTPAIKPAPVKAPKVAARPAPKPAPAPVVPKGLKSGSEVRLAAPSVEIRSIFVKHNAERNGAKGMNISVSLMTQKLKGVSCDVGASFFLATGEPVSGSAGNERTRKGQVYASTTFTPKVSSTYHTLHIFVPYSDFQLGSRQVELKFRIEVFTANEGAPLAKSDWNPFTYYSSYGSGKRSDRQVDKGQILFDMPYVGLVFGPILSALVIAVAASFMLETWGNVFGAMWRGAVMGLIYGLLIGGLVGVVGCFINNKVSVILGLVIGAFVPWAFHHYAGEYIPTSIWTAYIGSFNELGPFLGVYLSIGTGAALGTLLGAYHVAEHS